VDPAERKRVNPFEWERGFPEVFAQGGFDAVIGNPPYVEYAKVKDLYSLQGFSTLPCGNLYAMVFERSLAILRRDGRLGLIVPHSIAATYRANDLQELILKQLTAYFSYYSRRPESF